MLQELLSSQGYARLPHLLTVAECREIRELYAQSELFRSRIDMRRYRFGQGEYQYFAYPLPETVARLRRELYAQLAPNGYPPSHEEFLEQCRAAGQLRPTPLLLRYGPGDYNCLHQDLYGEVYFPYQVVIGLSAPEAEYTGGELVLVEQQPRAQSVARVIRIGQGEGIVITTRHRRAINARGREYRTNIRHGVSAIHSGERYTLGIVFHDGL